MAGSFGYQASIGYLNQDGILRINTEGGPATPLNYNHNMLDNAKVALTSKALNQDRISPNGVIGAGWPQPYPANLGPRQYFCRLLRISNICY